MSLPDLLRRLWRRARDSARITIGVPDYEAYLRHARQHHPEREPMSYAEFFADRQSARYRGTGGRCC
ncbi:YbdD/YjiX family protein [Arenimonas sp.]|uniref:YbdD/YjiX family protein n=1 Tax=Arenimonas sp. TaxID=1872635 RepID=UPI0039E377D2